jgi:hypothetical protein
MSDSVNPVDATEGMILPFAFIDKKQYSDYRKRLWNRDPNCTYCGKRIAHGSTTLDHIVPKSQGGLDTPSNLLLACERCNQAKDARSLVEWIQDLTAVAGTAEQQVTTGGVG